jgi:hypothetical protein
MLAAVVAMLWCCSCTSLMLSKIGCSAAPIMVGVLEWMVGEMLSGSGQRLGTNLRLGWVLVGLVALSGFYSRRARWVPNVGTK